MKRQGISVPDRQLSYFTSTSMIITILIMLMFIILILMIMILILIILILIIMIINIVLNGTQATQNANCSATVICYTVPGLCLDHDSLVQSVGRILGSLFSGSLFSSQVLVT